MSNTKNNTKTNTSSALRTSASRKQYSAAFKAQIVLEALRETKTIAQIASDHQLHPNLVTNWINGTRSGLAWDRANWFTSWLAKG